jgi:hypothetical protein
MNDECRGDEDGGAWWESNVNFQIPEDHMPPSIRIKGAKGGDCAPAKRKIGAVQMWFSDNIGANVESGGGPRSLGEVWSKALLFTRVVKRFLVKRIGWSIVRLKALGGKPGAFFYVFIL